MTKNEFTEKIENGCDIMFDVVGRHFTILTWMDEGIGIGEQYPNDGEIKHFRTAQELVDGYKIGDKSLGDLVNEIVITQYS